MVKQHEVVMAGRRCGKTASTIEDMVRIASGTKVPDYVTDIARMAIYSSDEHQWINHGRFRVVPLNWDRAPISWYEIALMMLEGRKVWIWSGMSSGTKALLSNVEQALHQHVEELSGIETIPDPSYGDMLSWRRTGAFLRVVNPRNWAMSLDWEAPDHFVVPPDSEGIPVPMIQKISQAVVVELDTNQFPQPIGQPVS